MIQIEEAVISNIIMHRVNRDQEKSLFSEQVYEYEDAEQDKVLKKIFLKPFTSHAVTCEFTHAVNLNYNVLFNLSKEISTSGYFVEGSKKIARHLIDSSAHPNIREGDLFIVLYQDIRFNNTHHTGLGIYKFEDKEPFIDASVIDKKATFTFKKGIGTKKPEKGCLILFTEEPYTILVIDNNSGETNYWQNDFINHKFKNDHINQTNDFLSLTRDFITRQVADDFEISKADQIDLLNRSVDYFKKHETFNKNEFEEEVFSDEGVINSFRNYNENFQREHQLDFADNFEISIQAVKKQARAFKSVLKLDKNFHIYIHGDRQLLEQGQDPDGRKFYKIYYQEES